MTTIAGARVGVRRVLLLLMLPPHGWIDSSTIILLSKSHLCQTGGGVPCGVVGCCNCLWLLACVDGCSHPPSPRQPSHPQAVPPPLELGLHFCTCTCTCTCTHTSNDTSNGTGTSTATASTSTRTRTSNGQHQQRPAPVPAPVPAPAPATASTSTTTSMTTTTVSSTTSKRGRGLFCAYASRIHGCFLAPFNTHSAPSVSFMVQ